MRPKPRSKDPQGELFRMRLENLLDHSHELYKLAHVMDWAAFDQRFGPLYADKVGRPGISTRVMVGMHYLKHAFDLSDEAVVAHFIENPYWQYLCGLEFFTHKLPIDPSSMTRWRRRVGVDGIEELLKQTIATAQRQRYLKPSDVAKVNVDTTVQEKAIAFPTDGRLYHKALVKLVKHAQRRGIPLRQSYKRKGKLALQKAGRYGHARQFKRARRTTKKLKTMFGAVIRDVRRKCPNPDTELSQLLENCERLHAQQRKDKGKLYSLWAPEVECISKGKAHKRYEFGCKVGIVSTSKKSWIIGSQAFQGNPYDGHTLEASLSQAELLTGWRVKDAFVDKGYRGSRESVPEVNVYWPDNRRKDRTLRRWMRRRSGVEPVIGHVKSDNRMDRNHLHGRDGDKMNALLAASGFNLRKLLRELSRALILLLFVLLQGVCGRRESEEPTALAAA